jgi:hypothetical protein
MLTGPIRNELTEKSRMAPEEAARWEAAATRGYNRVHRGLFHTVRLIPASELAGEREKGLVACVSIPSLDKRDGVTSWLCAATPESLEAAIVVRLNHYFEKVDGQASGA